MTNRGISDAPSQPRKSPKQKRSQLVVDSVIEACNKILVDYGEESLTITLLEAVSGVPKGSIYDYFPNIESIVASVYDLEFKHYITLGLEDLRAHQGHLSLEEELHYLAESVIGWHRQIAQLHSSFYHQYSLYYDAANRYRALFDDTEVIEDFIAPHVEREYQMDHMQALQAAKFVMEIFGSLFNGALRFYPDSIHREEFPSRIVSTCLGQLETVVKVD